MRKHANGTKNRLIFPVISILNWAIYRFVDSLISHRNLNFLVEFGPYFLASFLVPRLFLKFRML